MTKHEEDESFELQQKRWRELINIRQEMIDHKMDPAGVELAISNVFYPKKGSVIDGMILDAKELMTAILKLEVFQIDSSNLKRTLEKAFIPGMSGQYDVDLVRLKGMIKMREQMAQMGIPTGCIETTIAEVFQPLSPAAGTVSAREVAEVSATKPCSPMAETVEPLELDASATAIFRRSTAESDNRAELEASKAVVTTHLSSSIGDGNLVESPSRPTGWQSQEATLKPKSSDTESGKPNEMPFQPNTTEPTSSDVERISIIGTSAEAMDLDSPSATTSRPIIKAPLFWTSPSTVQPTKTDSNSSSSSTIRSKSSAKRSAPTDTRDTLGSAQNPICLRSSPTPKRQKAAKDAAPRAAAKKRESWRFPIQSVRIMGLHLKPRYDDTDLKIVFDVESQRIVFYKGEKSLTALYPGLQIDPDALLSVTRPTCTQSKQLKVRFMWLDTDVVETFLDIVVATKQDCRDLIAGLKNLTSFSEILLSEPRMNRLCEDATWNVKETQNTVGVSVTKFSENVWLD